MWVQFLGIPLLKYQMTIRLLHLILQLWKCRVIVSGLLVILIILIGFTLLVLANISVSFLPSMVVDTSTLKRVVGKLQFG